MFDKQFFFTILVERVKTRFNPFLQVIFYQMDFSTPMFWLSSTGWCVHSHGFTVYWSFMLGWFLLSADKRAIALGCNRNRCKLRLSFLWWSCLIGFAFSWCDGAIDQLNKLLLRTEILKKAKDSPSQLIRGFVEMNCSPRQKPFAYTFSF